MFCVDVTWIHVLTLPSIGFVCLQQWILHLRLVYPKDLRWFLYIFRIQFQYELGLALLIHLSSLLIQYFNQLF